MSSNDATASCDSSQLARESAVLLDIGGSSGAIVLRMPAALEGAELVLRPSGVLLDGVLRDGSLAGELLPDAADDGRRLLTAVAVSRRTPAGETVCSAVFCPVDQGRYELTGPSGGPVQLTVEVTGGLVTQADWPQ